MKPHYLIISSEFPPGPGGIGKHAYSMAKGLLHNGINVSVVCNMDYTSEDEISSFLNNNREINIHRITRNGFSTYINRIRTIISLYKKYRFDKVILTGQFSLWIGLVLKTLFKGVHTVLIIHGSELNMGGSVKQALTKKSILNGDKVFAVSNYTRSLLQSKIDRQHIEVLPNGLNMEDWNVEAEPFTWNGYPNLLTVGSVTQRKGQHNVINALHEIKKNYPDVHYHIVGKDADGTLKNLVQQSGLQSHVTFHGKLSDADLRRAYKTADIFCMLSDSDSMGDVEGFGIAILEANINGIPSIGSKGTGIEDAIDNGRTGILVDAHKPSEITNAIDTILKMDKVALADECKGWAKRHDWNQLAKKLI
ncbi:MAG TPA: glycosyltransferase family 4 protein [Flavipsychrobacter sp.]|nr:glycosyltransferase family 4 protein [Flavipsychrobacter sp.]